MTDRKSDTGGRASTSAAAGRTQPLRRRRWRRSPVVRLITGRIRRLVKADRMTMAAGTGMAGLLALLLTLVLLPKPFGFVHALAAFATLQLIAALHLALSLPVVRTTVRHGVPGDTSNEQLADLAWSLNEREARLHALLDGQDSIIFSRDQDGRVTFVNRAFCRLFGFEAKSLVGRTFNIPAVGEAGTPPSLQQVQTAFGPRWIAWQVQRIVTATGQCDVQSVGRDVTTERAAAAKLGAARDEAQAADLAKSRFLAAMSHEIRTPMSGILGMAGLLRGTEATSEQRTYADAIDRSARTLLTLIDEILDFSKIEAGRLTLDTDDFELESCVGSAVELLAPRAHEKGVELAWMIEPGTPLAVNGDEARVRQILLNLIGNAVKFTDRGGVLVRIAKCSVDGISSRARAGITISVEDTGAGIAAEDLPRLFKDFGQAERMLTSRKGGTGLGLAISRRLARAMGGDITVESRPGAGSIFRVDLMLQHRSERAAPAGAEGAAAGAARAEPRRVLLAFDRAVERRAAVGILSADGIDGSAVDAASAAAEVAKAVIEGRPYAVIVIDAAMGLEAAEALVAHARTANGSHSLDAMVLIDAATRPMLAEFRARGFAGWAVRPLRPKPFARLVSRGICDDEPVAPTRETPQRLALPDGRALRVLLAEDDDVNALLGSCVLRKAGCFATLVRTGRQAVEAVRAGIAAGEPDFDIILMDIVMPELGGVEATQAIHRLYATRTNGPRIAPPVVALTANAFAEDRQRYLAAGLDDYLSKPFDNRDLQALLGRWSTRLRASLAA